MPAWVRRLRLLQGGWFGVATACVLLAGSVTAQAQTALPWAVVQPVKASHFKVDVAGLFTQHLNRELGGGVVIHEATRDLGAPALAWSLAQAPQRRSIVLMSEEMSLLGESARHSAQHLAHYTPLLVLLETRWCFFAASNSPLLQADKLLDWAKVSVEPPRVAIPAASGRMRLWVQGMATRTNRVWEIETYGVGGDVNQALQRGADVAVGRCDQQWRNAATMRILAKGSTDKDGFLPHIPLFTELGWMPLGHGWLAWLAPKSLPPQELQTMAKLLHTVATRPDVHVQLQSTEQIVRQMTPEVSAAYLASYAQTWGDIGQLLLGRDFGDLSKMQGLAVPRIPGQGS